MALLGVYNRFSHARMAAARFLENIRICAGIESIRAQRSRRITLDVSREWRLPRAESTRPIPSLAIVGCDEAAAEAMAEFVPQVAYEPQEWCTLAASA
jgi:hypothetical protein